eukprot:gene35374-47533_t
MSILDRLRRPNHRLSPLGWIVLMSLLALVVAGVVWASRTPRAIPLLLVAGLVGAVLPASSRRAAPHPNPRTPASLRYMLDTNLCIRVLRDRPAGLRARFNAEAEGLAISTIVPTENRREVERFATRLETLPFDTPAADHAADIGGKEDGAERRQHLGQEDGPADGVDQPAPLVQRRGGGRPQPGKGRAESDQTTERERDQGRLGRGEQ